MIQRPTGTVTFLFTDIEGSTRMWEQHPDAMRDALALHDEILEREIQAAGGLVHSTAGDAYSAAFSDPADAIAAAISAQEAFQGAEWPAIGELRVRMAVHTGVAHERRNDYYGPALNRCARLLSAAHGGQIVTSLGTEELVRDRVKPGTKLTDLGEHQLKDLGHPEHIFQVVAPGLKAEFGPLRTLDPRLNNLPLQLTSFVGREDDLREVQERLIHTRLLTLTGVGGSGKTRLALQVAAETADRYSHGVWLVELAAVSDPDKLVSWLAETLRINRSQGVGDAVLAGETLPILDQIVEYLRKRTALLILDNCEHLISAAADLATYLLRECPDIKILATSREGLGIAGETLWQVPSLEMPTRFDESDARNGADALRLFAERASAVNPNFEITSETYPSVLKICRRLDGMPLAIELAAARARSLDVARISERLDDRFRLLTGGSRTAVPRQQTLAGVVEWSYNLLEEAEQVFFNRLAAFRGGFTLEAAERVCAGGLVDQLDVVDHLSSLVDKSMAVWEGGMGDRYRLLETLRQYATDKLKDAGEADDVRRRHAGYFLEVAEQAAPHLRKQGQVDWIERLETEHENFRAALAFTDENDMTESTARLAAALYWFWLVHSHFEEQQEWLGPLLGRENVGEDSVVLKLMLGYAWHLLSTDRTDQLRAHIHDTIGMAERLRDDARLAEAWIIDARLRLRTDDFQASARSGDRALHAAKASNDDWVVAWASYTRGWPERMKSNVDDALPYFDQATAGMRKIGDTYGVSLSAVAGGIMARYRLDYDTARRRHEESLEGALALDSGQLEAFNYACLGIIDFLEEKYEDAIANHQRAVEIHREVGATIPDVAENLGLLANSQLALGRNDAARASLAEGIDWLDDLGHPDKTTLANLLETVSGALLDRDADLACQLLGWATAIREEVGRPVPPPSRPAHEELEQRIQTATDDPEALAKEGATWSYEEALAIGRRALELI